MMARAYFDADEFVDDQFCNEVAAAIALNRTTVTAQLHQRFSRLPLEIWRPTEKARLVPGGKRRL